MLHESHEGVFFLIHIFPRKVLRTTFDSYLVHFDPFFIYVVQVFCVFTVQVFIVRFVFKISTSVSKNNPRFTDVQILQIDKEDQ